jgi:hypothetical protein
MSAQAIVGRDTSSRAAAPHPLLSRMPNRPVVIRTYPNDFAAQLAQIVLEAHDIPSMLQRDDAGGMEPMLAFLRGVRLMVRHEDAVNALRCLDEEAALAEADARDDDAPAA